MFVYWKEVEEGEENKTSRTSLNEYEEEVVIIPFSTEHLGSRQRVKPYCGCQYPINESSEKLNLAHFLLLVLFCWGIFF